MVGWCMAFFTYGYKLIETIAMAALPIEHVMHVQDSILVGFAPTDLAGVIVAVEYRFP